MNSTISGLIKKLTNICKKTATAFFIGLQFLFIIAIPVSAGFAINSHEAIAQATSQINYQGKLTNSSGVAVADGTYNMEFKLYTASTSGSLLWTETRTGTDKVQVTGGLFSVMLGSVSSLSGVDFNQPLYLGVNIGGTGSPSWDGEMTPRKTLGSVPSAFTAFTLEGLKKYQFLRSDVINSTSTASTYLKVEQAGAGGIAEFIANASTTLLGLYTTNGGQVTIGTSTPNSTNKLTVIGNSYFSSSTYMAVNGGNVGIGTTSPQYLLDVKKVGGTGTIIASFGDSANNSRLSFKPYDTSIEAFVQGNFGTTLKLNNGGFTVTDSGNTGNTLFSYDGVGLHANKITSANVAGNTYNRLSLTSNYYPISTATSAINFTTYNSAGNSDQLSKLQIFNGDTGNMLLLPSGGNVGIGSSTPGSTLSVNGDISFTGALRANGNAGTNGMVLQTTGTGVTWVATSSLGISGGSSNYLTLVNGGLQTATSTDFIRAAYFVATSTTATSTFAGRVAIGDTAASSTLFIKGTAGVNPFAIASSTGAELFSILQNGNVGISTSSPLARFSLVGDSATTSSGSAPSVIAAYGGTGGSSGGTGGGFLFVGGTGGSTSGVGGSFNVTAGAGGATSGTGGAINLTGGAGGSSSTGGSVIIAGGSTTLGGIGGSVYIYSQTPPSGGTAGNVILGMTSGLVHSGNVGVGTTSPNAKFTVVGTSSLSVIFDVASTSNASILRVTSSGNVGIGTTSPSDKLSVTGDFNLTGALRANGNAGTNGMVLQTTGTGLTWVATSSLGIIGGSGTNYLSLGSGFIYTSTSTDYFKSAYFVATSTTATSTFASAIGIGTSTALATLDVYGNVILSGSNRYLNFGTTSSVNGYGFRDNAGALEYKNSGGSWSAFTAGGSGTPGGASGQVQFNDGGNFGADANFTYDKASDFLGLGTSTPGARLVVVGTTTADQIVIGGGTPFPNSVAHFGGNVNSYLQANIQNRSNGATASSDFVASSDIGTDVANYVDFGINSSGFNSASFTIAGANEGYLYSQSSSLAIGVASTSASTSVKFFTGGTLAENERMRIDSTGNVGIGLTSPTEKLSVAGNILIGARSDVTPTWTKRSNATAGTITTGGTASIGTTSAMAVFNGSLYVGTSKGNGAEVYRYNGNNWTQVSSTTPGAIGTSTTVNIDTISSMAVWNGHLYIGTAETAAAEVYRYNGNSSWTKISSTTAGAIGGNSTTSAINSISAMVVHGGKMYIGTSKTNGAEVVRYNGSSLSMQQTWTKVSNIATNAGTIGATANVDAVTALVSYQGYMYAGTSEGTTGGLYRYDGQGTSGTGFTIIGTAGTFSGTGAAGASTVTGMGAVRTAAVYNGKLYLGIGSVTNGAGTGRVVKWDGNLTAGTNHELVSSSTAGVISEDIGATTGIDRIGAMAVYKDDLYIGTYDSTGIAEVYKLDGGNTWTKYSSTTAGTISTSTGAQTTAITGVLSMQAFNDDLWVGTEKATGAEVYSLNMTEGQSYDLAFEASSDNADAIQNGQKNKAWIQFQAEETTYNNAGNMNTGKFVFSHGINTVTGAYDLAEDYPTRDDMLAPGDLVSLDTKEKGYVRRAQGKNDKDIIGIYSVDPALRLSQKDPLIDGARAIPVALAGRVPVTVTLENGPIKIGDYLTSSAEPGKAAKATKPGRVIGRALGMYSGIEGEVPSVSVFLGAESISWNDLQDAADDATALAEGEDVDGVTSVADFVDTINTRAEDIVFALLNKADNLAIVIANNLTAITATIQDLFIKTLSVLPGGSIALPSGENQIAGVGMLSAGATDTFIANTQIEEDSVIYLSPTSDIDTPLYVFKKEAGKGFSVRTKRAMADTNITFDWFFIKTYKPKNSGDQVMTTVGGTSSSTDPTTITSVSTDTQNVTSSGNTEGQGSTTSQTENNTVVSPENNSNSSSGDTSESISASANETAPASSPENNESNNGTVETIVKPEATTVESAPAETPPPPAVQPAENSADAPAQ